MATLLGGLGPSGALLVALSAALSGGCLLTAGDGATGDDGQTLTHAARCADVPGGCNPAVGELIWSDSPTPIRCTATLIHPSFVVTDSACDAFDSMPLARFGDGSSLTSRNVVAFHHSPMGTSWGGHGWALAELDQAITHIAPVVMAASAPRAADALRIEGYGATTSVGVSTSDKRFGQNQVGAVRYYEFNTSAYDFSPVWSSGDTNGCGDGDRGGPALRRGADGGEELAGMLWRSSCEDPTTFTLAATSDFLRADMAKCFASCTIDPNSGGAALPGGLPMFCSCSDTMVGFSAP